MLTVNNNSLKRLFKKYNQEYFNDELPSCRVSLKKLCGLGCYYEYKCNDGSKIPHIILSEDVDWTVEALRYVLLHEMIHCHVRYVEGCGTTDGFSLHGFYGHGRRFNKQRKRIKEEFGIDVPIFIPDLYRKNEKIPSTRFGKLMRFISLYLSH